MPYTISLTEGGRSVITRAEQLSSRSHRMTRLPSEYLTAPLKELEPLGAQLEANLLADLDRYDVQDPCLAARSVERAVDTRATARRLGRGIRLDCARPRGGKQVGGTPYMRRCDRLDPPAPALDIGLRQPDAIRTGLARCPGKATRVLRNPRAKSGNHSLRTIDVMAAAVTS